MYTTIETRLILNKEQEEMISSCINLWSSYYRKTWVLYNNKKLNELQIYHELKKSNLFTAYQINSLIDKVKNQHSKAKELTKSTLNKLIEKTNNIKRFILNSNELINKKENQIISLKNNLNLIKNLSQKEIKSYYAKINELDKLIKEKNWLLVQKQIKLNRLNKLIYTLNKRVHTNTFKLCFGSSKLLSQRSQIKNHKFEEDSLTAWKNNWDLSRNNIWVSKGDKSKPKGNPEMKIDIESKTLQIRLLEHFAKNQLILISKEKNITLEDLEFKKDRKLGQLRTIAKYLIVNNVNFNSKNLIKLNSVLNNKSAIMVQIVKKISSKNDIGYYLQIIFEEQIISPIKLSNHPKTMGLDLNQKGIGYCIVKPDGNKLKNGHGFIEWSLHNKTIEQKNYIISNSLNKILDIVQKNGAYNIAIENLDFSKTIAKINSGYKINQKYNKIITQFPISKFKTILMRKAQRLGITVSLVNAHYSSIGGYSKYGLINNLPVDVSAAIWLARQSIYGKEYKKEENLRYIKKFEESVSLPYISQSKQSKRLKSVELQWKDIGLELGKDRKLWYKHTMVFINKISNSGTSLLQQDFNPFEDPLVTYIKGDVDVQAQEDKKLERSIKMAST